MNKYFILLFVLLAGCKRNEVSDPATIYPLPYLPVYPGSTWNYVDENGDTIILKTDNSYELNSYQSAATVGNYTDPAYVPYWDGAPVYGYSTPKETTSPAFHPNGLSQVAYLSETEGKSWGTYSDQYGYSWRTVAKVDTSITVNSISFNHVIVVADSGEMNESNAPGRLGKIDYYAKNVGLIKEDWVKYQDSSIYQHLGIINYKINH